MPLPALNFLPKSLALQCLLLLAIGRAQDAAPTPAVAVNAPPPRVWIFNGTPGDDEHHDFYEKNIAALRETLTTRFGVPKERLTVLYGPQSAGYDGPCTREALKAELDKIVTFTNEPGAGAAWIIFQGHANAIAAGANFNLPGPDMSARDIGEALKGAKEGAPMVVLATTACGAAFVKPLAGPGRKIIASTVASDPENETDFPTALADALAAPESDANKDGIVSVTELFLACHESVKKIHDKGGFMLREHSQLDGNGDGRATQRPSPADGEGGATLGLRVTTDAKKKFD